MKSARVTTLWAMGVSRLCIALYVLRALPVIWCNYHTVLVARKIMRKKEEPGSAGGTKKSRSRSSSPRPIAW